VNGLGEPLTLAHQSELEPLLNAARAASVPQPQHTLSDATFANLYLFRAAHDWRYLRSSNTDPCIHGKAYDGTRVLLPLGDWTGTAAPAESFAESFACSIAPLSDAQAAALPPTRFTLSASRDDADYLYRAEAFRHYRGSVLQKKRNLVKQLLAAHAVQAEPYHEGLAAEALQVLDGWMQDKAQAAGAADDAPCREALALASRLGLQGTLYRMEGRAAGFLLAENLAPGVMVMRFAKALEAAKGLYQHMFQHFCQNRPELEWLNFEQDLGSPNFRQTKLSYQPAALLSKHRARLR
jgi:uncharacterized protein